MKALKRISIFIFLTGMILGVMGQDLLYGCETGGGNPWDTCVNCWCLDKHAKGTTTLKGTLSIYFADRSSCPNGPPCWDPYFIVRLAMDGKNDQLFVFREQGDIVEDILNQTGLYLCNFLQDVINQLFPNQSSTFSWAVKKYDDPWGTYQDEQDLQSRAFVTDIKIVVKE